MAVLEFLSDHFKRYSVNAFPVIQKQNKDAKMCRFYGGTVFSLRPALIVSNLGLVDQVSYSKLT